MSERLGAVWDVSGRGPSLDTRTEVRISPQQTPTIRVVPQALVIAKGSDTAEVVREALVEAGLEVAVAPSGTIALQRLESDVLDLVILEVIPNTVSGIDLIREIREGGHDVPVIVLGAGESETERVLSLDLGADDYVTKPYSPRELASRSRAILRRVRRERVGAGSARSVGSLQIDLAMHEVSLGERLVDVTASEFRVLELLSSSPGKVFTRRQIMEHLWSGPYFGDGHPVDTHMVNLRRKIEIDPKRPSRLLTVRGVGFRLVAPMSEVVSFSTEGIESDALVAQRKG
jgi:DNA-binding response OmpR family regulator